MIQHFRPLIVVFHCLISQYFSLASLISFSPIFKDTVRGTYFSELNTKNPKKALSHYVFPIASSLII